MAHPDTPLFRYDYGGGAMLFDARKRARAQAQYTVHFLRRLVLSRFEQLRARAFPDSQSR